MGRRGSVLRGIDWFLLICGAIVVAAFGVLIGNLTAGSDSESGSGTVQASQIGNAEAGRELFVSQRCSMCHSYEGRGGADAPDLDFMRGKMTVTDIANMSGVIWDHVPAMKAAFEEEGIEFPEFEGNQMASLIAYLHGGGPPPPVKESAESPGEEHGDGDADSGHDDADGDADSGHDGGDGDDGDEHSDADSESGDEHSTGG